MTFREKSAWASLIATLMSTLSYLGAPGEMIKHGIGQSISLLALPFAFVVVGFLWVPFYMRLNLTSAYEYLERRFGTGARMLGVIAHHEQVDRRVAHQVAGALAIVDAGTDRAQLTFGP